jgi:hypothetical protein
MYLSTNDYVARSHTGKLHITTCGNSTSCNAGATSRRVEFVTAQEIRQAGERTLCKKCFAGLTDGNREILAQRGDLTLAEINQRIEAARASDNE